MSLFDEPLTLLLWKGASLPMLAGDMLYCLITLTIHVFGSLWLKLRRQTDPKFLYSTRVLIGRNLQPAVSAFVETLKWLKFVLAVPRCGIVVLGKWFYTRSFILLHSPSYFWPQDCINQTVNQGQKQVGKRGRRKESAKIISRVLLVELHATIRINP